MLSVAMLTPDRGAYLEEQVASSRDDYYAGHGESPGRWRGTAAAALGLEGTVAEGALARLVDGCHPATGARLRRPIARRTRLVPGLDPETGERIEVEQVQEPVGGFDLVFGAPKSISLAAALAPVEVRREVVAAHHAAVAAALELLEREACGVRLGHGGAEHAAGSGIVAALYVHRTSREGDPHLHTHCAVGNLTQGPDGGWRALDSRLLLSGWKRTLGFAYQAALRHEVGRRLGWEWDEPVKGMAELAAWPRPAMRELSTRRRQVERALDEHGGRGWHAGQIATLATRAPKRLDQVDLDEQRVAWRARLAEHGMGEPRLAAALRRGLAPAPSASRDELAALAERLAGPEGLTATANTFRRADVVRELAGGLRQGAPVDGLVRLADWFLAQPRLCVRLDRDLYTTPDLLACEERLLDLVARGRDRDTAVLMAPLVERAIAGASVALTAEQAAAVRGITTSGHAVENLEARAGSGKTTVCGVIAAAYRTSGYEVIGATPTARAARELSAAGVPATTIDALLTRVRARHAPPPRRLVIIADENGMAGTRQMAELATWARTGRAKIVQVGDSRQLASVPAGGAFAAVSRRHGAHHLDDVHRQRDPADVDALAALRRGDATTFVEHQLRRGRLVVAADQRAAVADAARWYEAAAAEHGPQRVAVICRDNALRDQANHAVRRLRAARGELAGAAVETDHAAFQVGDRVVCRRNDRDLQVDNGTRATVTRVNTASRTLDLKSDDGRRLRLPASYLDAGHLEHAYALTAHALQGSTLETACVLSQPDDHDRQWTYTAASRTRGTTRHLLVSPEEDARHAITRLLQTIAREATEPLARELHREPLDTAAVRPLLHRDAEMSIAR